MRLKYWIIGLLLLSVVVYLITDVPHSFAVLLGLVPIAKTELDKKADTLKKEIKNLDKEIKLVDNKSGEQEVEYWKKED